MSDPTPPSVGGPTPINDLLEEVPPAPARAPRVRSEEEQRRRRRILAVLLAILLLLVGSILAWYLLTRKPLTELPGVKVVPLPQYKTAIYGISKPVGVAVSPDGERIYATQSGSPGTTFMFDRDGNKVAELKAPSDSGAVHTPVYVAVSPDGSKVYVGDRAAGAIYVYGADGTYQSTFAPADKTLSFSPLGIAVASDGTLYVANVLSNKATEQSILVFAPDGRLLKSLGKGELSFPNGVVVDAAGNVFVTDSNAGRLVVFDTAGKLTTLVQHGVGEGDLGLPRGLGIDDRGRIFVVDTTDHMVRMYTAAPSPTGTPTYAGSIGDQGVADAKFMYPNGLAVDTRARIYVTDRENNRIQVWGF